MLVVSKGDHRYSSPVAFPLVVLLHVVSCALCLPQIPKASVHVQFVSSPLTYAHGLDIISAFPDEVHSSPYAALPAHNADPQGLWPNGVFLPPGENEIPDFYTEDSQDDELLTDEATLAYIVKNVLFFGEFPHERALLKLQKVRRSNKLAGNKLATIRSNWARFVKL